MRETGADKGDYSPDPLDRPGSSAAAMLANHVRVLELVATGKPLVHVLEAVVEAVETHCAGTIGSVLLMEDDGEHLRHGAAPGLPESYNRAVDGLRIGPRAGSCGTAAYRGEPVIVEDIATDPPWSDYRELAAEHDLGACWSHPIFSPERRVLGTLAMYYRQPRSPTAEDRKFIAAVAQLAAIAVERRRAEHKRRVAERRLLKQKTVLVDLAKSEPLSDSDFAEFCKLATEAAAATLAVERVSVWLFNAERTILGCRSLYELSLDRHSRGIELESSMYPRYFAALERGRGVVAHDARRDPDTSEFAESYLEPLGITSMLDAPVRRSGRLVGVVCHEHVGPRRVWAADEQDFAASIGDFVSLVLEGAERKRAEQSFRSTQEELLRRRSSSSWTASSTTWCGRPAWPRSGRSRPASRTSCAIRSERFATPSTACAAARPRAIPSGPSTWTSSSRRSADRTRPSTTCWRSARPSSRSSKTSTSRGSCGSPWTTCGRATTSSCGCPSIPIRFSSRRIRASCDS
jgi:GAF domain-containing protein